MPSESIQDEVCPMLKLKPLLGKAEAETLGCAMALTKDKKEFALLVDAKMAGTKVRDKMVAELGTKIDKATVRFGSVAVEKVGDAGTVRFCLNKAAPGGAVSLLVRLMKRAGYEDVVLSEDDALEAAAPGGQAVPAVAAAPEPAAPPPAGDAKVRLGGLIKRIGPIVAAAPTLKESLLALAREAQTKLVAGQPIEAELAALNSALEAASATGPAGVADAPKPADGPAVALTKSGALWRGTRAQMRGKLDNLKAAILEAYADEKEVQASVQQNFGALDKIFEMLDDRLDTALDKAVNAKDPNERLEFITQTRAIIDEYTQKVATDSLIVQLDANPFGIDMKFKDTLDKVLPALSGLARTLH